MSFLLSMLLAQAPVLPEVDRRAIELQARAEAIQTRRTPPVTRQGAIQAATVRRPAATHPTTVAARRPVQQAAIQARNTASPIRPASLRRASGGALDLSAITTICRAAGNQADPAAFITTMTRAYSLDTGESQSLRTSCAAYLAGRADARTSDYGAPAH